MSLCHSITCSVFSPWLNIFSHSSLTALVLVCITVQHWLELSALAEHHLSCWSVEYLYANIKWWEIRRRALQSVQNRESRTRLHFGMKGKKKEVKLKKGVWARLRRSRRGDEEEEVKDKEGKGKMEGESGRAREQAKNAWQSLSILRWMDNVRSMQYTEQHSLCYLTFVHLSLSYTCA